MIFSSFFNILPQVLYIMGLIQVRIKLKKKKHIKNLKIVAINQNLRKDLVVTAEIK
jgi:hypothetical protein